MIPNLLSFVCKISGIAGRCSLGTGEEVGFVSCLLTAGRIRWRKTSAIFAYTRPYQPRNYIVTTIRHKDQVATCLRECIYPHNRVRTHHRSPQLCLTEPSPASPQARNVLSAVEVAENDGSH